MRNIVFQMQSQKYNLKKIIKSRKINITEIRKPLSSYRKLIKKIKPDIIINSASLYIKKDILKIPKFGSINRH